MRRITALLVGVLVALSTRAHAQLGPMFPGPGVGSSSAFPAVMATNTSFDTTNSTSKTVNLPASIAAGELLVIIIATGNTATVSASGWTFLSQDSNGTISTMTLGYKTATGAEGATVTVTLGTARKFAATSYRISGWGGAAPEKGTAATGSSVSPDPPSLTPSWGTKNTLWLAAYSSNGSAGATGYPSSYSNGITATTGATATQVSIASAERQRSASSEDPGAFTQATAGWVAQTFGISP